VTALAARPGLSVLAFAGLHPVGLVNCIEASSACRPLVNVQMSLSWLVTVGKVSQKMLALAESARWAGACG
jgi:hypothetical protein